MIDIGGIILAIALAQEPTVAVILTPDTSAEIMLLSDAEAQFAKLCADGTDDRRLKALAAAINPMPNWEQFVVNNDPSVCNRNPKPIAVPKP
jgi:hypothetical protein